MSSRETPSTFRIGFLHSVLRPEEKLLLEAFSSRGVDVELLDDRTLGLVPAATPENRPDGVVARSVSASRNLYAREVFETWGIPCFNSASVAATCMDKLKSSLALVRAVVPHPELRVAFTEESALQAIEEMGYPVVLKPLVGSWGRLIARANDRETAESLLEHKAALGGYQHQIYYLQRYVDKGSSDLRSFVVGDRCIAAIRRTSAHWKTNTALGAEASGLTVTPELAEISLAAARAVGGGILAVDVFETPAGYLVNEVNDTMEFRNSIPTTGVDIPGEMADFVVGELRRGRAR